MEKSWLPLAGLCSVVFGIILFSIIFGGYSSLIRAQKRINSAKSFMIDECEKRFDLLSDLAAMAKGTALQDLPVKIQKPDKKASLILTQINSIKTPVKKELIEEFEHSQTRLTQDINVLITEFKKNPSITASNKFSVLQKNAEQIQNTILYACSRYNKEVRYFNKRKKMFPGFLIAKLFELDKFYFYEIAIACFDF